MYTWAERSVMRCSQACDAVYLRRARRRSTPRRCPWTCSCRTGTHWRESRWTRPAIHRRETAVDPRPFPFPYHGIFVCTPIDRSTSFVRKERVFALSFFLSFPYPSRKLTSVPEIHRKIESRKT